MTSRMSSSTESHQYLLLFSIRPTVRREAIMDYLLDNRYHPTIDEIYQALKKTMPTLSRMTIYTSLDLFARSGAILPLKIDKENVRFDIKTDAHAHFVCKRCGAIHNIESHDSAMFVLPQNTNFAMSSVEVVYTGVCQSCLLKCHLNSYSI